MKKFEQEERKKKFVRLEPVWTLEVEYPKGIEQEEFWSRILLEEVIKNLNKNGYKWKFKKGSL